MLVILPYPLLGARADCPTGTALWYRGLLRGRALATSLERPLEVSFLPPPLRAHWVCYAYKAAEGGLSQYIGVAHSDGFVQSPGRFLGFYQTVGTSAGNGVVCCGSN